MFEQISLNECISVAGHDFYIPDNKNPDIGRESDAEMIV
jgi:hypothetical protein